MLSVIYLIVMLSVVMLSIVAQCHYVDCRNAEYNLAVSLYRR